ncbi:MAG: hypothetical protein KAH93_00915 [Candidatus Aenigmarchaeota archaeon]|nr:hypothetical protein [Candidatus Aenigmarchaeota archaeon]
MTKRINGLFSAALGALVVFFIVIAQASASSSCTVISPSDTIWYNKNNRVEIRCTCPADTAQLQNTFVTKLYGKYIDFTGAGSAWVAVVDIDSRLESAKYGVYEVSGDCLDVNYTKIGNFSGSFEVHELRGEIVAPTRSIPVETYLTNSTSVEYRVYKDGKILTLDSLASAGGTLNFDVYLSNDATSDKKIADTNSASYDPSKESWIIPCYRLDSVPDLTSENKYDLKVDLSYTEPPSSTILLSSAQTDALITMKSLVVSLVPGTISNIIDLTTSTKKDIKLRVIYQGGAAESLDLTHFDIYMERDDGERTLNLVDEKGFTFNDGDGYYVLPVNIIQQDPGSYDLKISVWYPGVGEVIFTGAEVRFVLAFQGQLVDSNGNVVSASIVLRNNKTEIPFATDGAGRYNVPVTADTYDIAMRFPQVWKAEVYGVEIFSTMIDSINYDYFSGSPEIEGLTVAKLVVLEFGMPFESAYLEIPYDDGAVDNEKNIETYKCTNWNFGKRKCIGEWVEVSTVVNIVRDMVSFNTNRLSAFVIGERRGLWLDAALDKRDYFSRERMTLTGKVLDTKSVEIEGVEVYYTVEGTEISGKTTSGAGGIFTAILSAPDVDGLFNLVATAKRSPYMSYNMTYEFEVTRKKEVNLQVPETVDFVIGEAKTMNINVFNTGQTELTNVMVSISGLKDTWYTMEPTLVESIPAGERINVDLNVHIPPEDCDGGSCNKYYFVNVDFASNEVNEKTAFTAKIGGNESVTEEEPAVNEEEVSFSVPDMTGLVSFSSAGRTNIYMSLFFAFVAFVIITIKKKQRRSGYGGRVQSRFTSRGGSVSSLNAIKSRLGRRK